MREWRLGGNGQARLQGGVIPEERDLSNAWRSASKGDRGLSVIEETTAKARIEELYALTVGVSKMAWS